MKWLRGIALLVVLALALVLSQVEVEAAPPQQGPADWAIAGGRFFTQTANGRGGFSVVDDGQARFWAEYQRLGGAQTVGYPISRRFTYDGFTTQAFQKLVLQWRPEVRQAWPVNVLDELSEHGFDDPLYAFYQTPYPLRGFDPPGASWAQIVAGRQGLLSANPAIRARYFSVRDPLNVFGLPTSRVEDMGNHYAIRTQRAVFQQWKQAVPWAAAGQVTIANGGDIAKSYSLFPSEALVPEGGPTPQPTPTPPPPARPWEIRTVLVGPGTPGRIYVLQQQPGPEYIDWMRILVSDDQGGSWYEFRGGLPVSATCVHGLDMDYATADTLYASTCLGLYRWSGTTWDRVSEQVTLKVVVAYGEPRRLWAYTYAQRPGNSPVIFSEDGGRTWQSISRFDNFIPGSLDIALDPRTNDRLYVLTQERNTNIHRRDPNGQWVTLSNPPYAPVIAMSVHGATGDLYVSTGSTLWRSSNPTGDPTAVTWQQSYDFAGEGGFVQHLASGKSSSNGLALYAILRPFSGARDLLYQSIDGGQNWYSLYLPN